MSVENKIYKRNDGEDLEPETWWRAEGNRVLVACKHNNAALIRGGNNDWSIAPDGTVSPSLYWRGSCECHIWLKLEGWVS